MAGFIVVGRHAFTSRQYKLLEMANLKEKLARIEQVSNPAEVVSKAKELGADAIVVQALPMPILAQLLQAAARAGLPVYGFRVEAVALAQNWEEAERLADETGADILLPSREGTIRVAKTVALQRIKRIVVEAEDVVSLP